MTETAAEIARLERLLKKRTNTPGWQTNCAAIQEKLAELKAGNG